MALQPSRNVLIALGTLSLAYVMLKIYKKCVEKSSQKNSDLKNDDEKKTISEASDKDNSFEGADSNVKSNKRKLEETEGSMKIFRPRPNFFLGFQIYDTEIHKKVKKLQEVVVAQNPKLHSALINISTLHVTLAVTHLANEKEIKLVKEKLDEWYDKNSKDFFKEPVVLNFKGVKTFKDIVAYIDMDNCKNYKKLTEIATSVNNLLSSAGFSIERRSLIPHLTFLKLSRDPKLLKSKKQFKESFDSLKKCKDYFGQQEVSHIQLLSMDQQKDLKGYYKCFHQINIKDFKIDGDHSECCSPISEPKEK